MCGQCRSADMSDDWYNAGVEESLAGRRRGRVELTAAADELVSVLGLRVKTYPGAVTMTVEKPTGSSRVVAGVSGIVAAAEALSGHSFDPLADALITRREQRRTG